MEVQDKQNKKPLMIVIVSVITLAALALGAINLVPRVVQAQDATPQVPNVPGQQPVVPGQQPNAPGQQPGGRGPGFGDFRGFGVSGRFERQKGFGGDIDYDALLADALGITVEELQAAREKANQAALEQAVAKGYITEEQAGLIKAQNALKQYINKDEIIAKALGISVEELQAARDEGKNIGTLISELGLEAATVRENMQTAYKAAIQQAVSDGVITQEQADQILSGGFGMHGFEFGGDMRRFHGPGGFQQPSTEATPGSGL